MKIDVVLLTKNSETYLNNSLLSILLNIPINRVIIIDAYSTDSTLDIIESFQRYNPIDIYQKPFLRGKARKFGIGKVTTEWFAFVDSDVILCENWFKKIWKIKQNFDSSNLWIGAIEGNVNNQTSKRAYTNCTLIWTRLVKDIEIPEDLHVLEDMYIRNFIEIEKPPYKWIKAQYVNSQHLSHSNILQDAYLIGKFARKYRLIPLYKFIGLLFTGKRHIAIQNLKGYFSL